MGDRTELALGTKIAVSVPVGELFVLGQGSQVLVGLSDGCQEIQRLLAGAAARELELIFRIRRGFIEASRAVDVGWGGWRVEHCFAVVDDEGVQALAVNDVVARACDAARNLGDGIDCNVVKAQDASVAWFLLSRQRCMPITWCNSEFGLRGDQILRQGGPGIQKRCE